MQLFILDENPILSAAYHCDRHMKMILETAQMLSTSFWLQNIEAPYAKTHHNHPCSIWMRESKENFEWCLELGRALSEENIIRYKKPHKSSEVIEWARNNYERLSFPSIGLTPFVTAIKFDKQCRRFPKFDEFSAIDQYRLYYIFDKPFATWKTQTPPWYYAI